ncbi:MAG: 30S ribosomal protein S12 methylthiotransferase RimO, partial [Candidatus Heimdallarchaeota archaeon]
MKEKISVITMGCSKNTVDSERLMAQLKINDFELVDDPNNADSVIINTCGFIDT